MFHKRSENLLEGVPGLGDMTDVFKDDFGPDWFGDQFFANAAKSYGIRLRSTKNSVDTRWHIRAKGLFLKTYNLRKT